MREPFAISVENWLAPESGDPADRMTTAELKIRVRGEVATCLEDRFSKSVRDTARVSAYRLAYWLADNWWRLRWEPEDHSHDWMMSHRLGAVGGGYLWPDLTIASDGESVTLVTSTGEQSAQASIRYLSGFVQVISPREYERGLDAFIGQVVQRLTDLRVAGLDLPELWREVNHERGDPELARLRRFEAILGCDAGHGDAELMQALIGYSERFGSAAVDEVAAAAKFANAREQMEALQSALQVHEEHLSDELTLAGLQALRSLRDQVGGRQRLPWQSGEALADAARRLWSIGSGPLPSERLAGLAGAPAALLGRDPQPAAGPLAMGAALRNPEDRERFRVFMRSRLASARRFEFARMLADQIWASPTDTLLPVTRAKTARQKLQRAFAGEFLCPYRDLIEIVDPHNPDDEAIEQAALLYEVSPLVVRTRLVDKGYRGHELLAA